MARPVALPSVGGDPALFRRVWTHLLSNARIAVAGEQQGDHFHYRVRDSGAGFDLRHADKLSGVFQRLQSQDEFEGTESDIDTRAMEASA